jgi:hypothetical protein
MALSGAGMTVDVHDCVATGAGPLANQAQNGIQVGFGAGGSVSDCSISNVDYTPATFVASGLLMFDGTSVVATGLSFTACQAPVSWYDTDGSMDDISSTGGSQFGPIFVYNSSISKVGASTATRRMASPALEESVDKAGAARIQAAMSVSITNACLTGTNLAGSAGVYALSEGGPLAVTVDNCILANWDVGLVADDAATSLTANTNSITGNTSGGYDNTLSGSPQNAEANWWGSGSGPSGAGPGTGDAIVGAAVDFTPWRTNGIDASPDCGFQPNDNLAGPTSPTSCLSITNACVTVPFTITRTDAVGMRAFSVKFELSSELELCSGTSSITQGTYLNSIGTTTFQVLDNGGGMYTVDCAILGMPCGATAASGTLFNVAVKSTVLTGTGTVTPLFVTLRDCANATIAGAPGPAASVTIDNIAPSKITPIAIQDKSGNGADGTTFIDVILPVVDATDVIRVYRKGFGNYPEYDDAPGAGSVPSQPTSEAAAISGGWTLAFTQPGPAGVAVAHEPPTRDFWYFVGFVEDACGNVSNSTSMTVGTLNYHLGDTHNGLASCSGNNLVGTSDISFLGAHYGATLVASDTLGCLDVGPTTDFSVDTRPTTDNQIQFEDLIMFAINHGQVSKSIAHRTPSARDGLSVLVPERTEPGTTLVARLWVSGTGRIQGLSARLTWNAAVVEPLGIDGGEMLRDLNGVALTPAPGTVDVALLGVRDQAITGEGELASVRFRVLGAGDPRIVIAAASARDARNQLVELTTTGGTNSTDGNVPRVTTILANVPNPFNPTTKIPFTLAIGGRIEVAIYGVNGHKVRTLLHGDRVPGLYEVLWNGTNDAGARVGSGAYYVRLVTVDGTHSRPIMLVK